LTPSYPLIKGLAWVYDMYCKKDICDKWRLLEKEARQSKTGLWLQDDPGVIVKCCV
jgi:endonuclease YncB( thermonuclease family)